MKFDDDLKIGVKDDFIKFKWHEIKDTIFNSDKKLAKYFNESVHNVKNV
jgi:hypothetical protein